MHRARHDGTPRPHLLARLHDAPISIALRWSLYIGVLIASIMGLLAWVMIAQQERAHIAQMDGLGRALVEQLAQAASEPLLAEDDLALKGLVSRAAHSERVVGAAVTDANAVIAAAGAVPQQIPRGDAPVSRLVWASGTVGDHQRLVSYFGPIRFREVRAGQAVITLDRNLLDAALDASVRALAVTTLILLAIGILLAIALSRRLSRPIQDLARVGASLGGDTQTPPLERRRRDEIGQIIETFNQMTQGLKEKQRVERALNRYLSPRVAKDLMTVDEVPTLGGRAIDGSVLFCDIVGFTELAEGLAPIAVAELLNDYLGYIAVAGHSCNGFVDKFIGDSVMVVFGAPDPDPRHAWRAVTCAVLIREVVERLNRQRRRRGERGLRIRIGINSGEMVAGNIGAVERMEYTVIGDAVNLASRLCSQAPPDGILMSGFCAQQPGVAEVVDLLHLPPLQVKGRREPVTPCLVRHVAIEHRDQLRRALDHIVGPEEHDAVA